MNHVVSQDLRASLRRPEVIALSLLIIIGPALNGYLTRYGYALDNWVSYFINLIDAVAMPFPLLVTLLTQPRLVDEWSNTYALSTRTRLRPRSYFASKVYSSALISGVVFTAMMLNGSSSRMPAP